MVLEDAMDGRWRKGWKLDVFWKVGSDYHVNLVSVSTYLSRPRLRVYIGWKQPPSRHVQDLIVTYVGNKKKESTNTI